MHPGAEQLVGHRAADQRRGDVVEEARDDEHHHQHQEAAAPVGRQEARQDHRHVALLEVPRQQRKAGEQAEQVGNGDPLMAQVADEARHPDARLEAGEGDLVEADRREAAEGHVQRDVVEQRDAQQGQRKQDELDGDAADGGDVTRGKGRQGRQQQTQQQAVHGNTPGHARHAPICGSRTENGILTGSRRFRCGRRPGGPAGPAQRTSVTAVSTRRSTSVATEPISACLSAPRPWEPITT